MRNDDRTVRVCVLDLLVDGRAAPTAAEVADAAGITPDEAAAALHRLAAAHRLVLTPDGSRVAMAHPFSGIRTDYRSEIGNRTWWANCGWDAFAILALLGDGQVLAHTDTGEVRWDVHNGVVTPEGLVHFVVAPRHFWDDIAFT